MLNAKTLRSKLLSVRPSTRVTLKDLHLLLQSTTTGDYSEVFKTKLYNKEGGAYCEALAIIEGFKEEAQ